MTRAEQIADLMRQYASAVAQGKRKRASIILAQLCALRTRQLNAEMRKKAA